MSGEPSDASVDIAAHHMAMEHMLAQAYALLYRGVGFTDAQIEEAHEIIRRKAAERVSVDWADPVLMARHQPAFEAHVARILTRIESLWKYSTQSDDGTR